MMARLSTAERNCVIGMLQAGRSKRFAARLMQCTRVTIDRLLRRFQQNGNVADRPRTSRPKGMTPQDRYSRLQHARERYRPATVTARTPYVTLLVSVRYLLKGLVNWIDILYTCI